MSRRKASAPVFTLGATGRELDELCRAYAAVSAASGDGRGVELAAGAVLDGALRHGRALLEHDLAVRERWDRFVKTKAGRAYLRTLDQARKAVRR